MIAVAASGGTPYAVAAARAAARAAGRRSSASPTTPAARSPAESTHPIELLTGAEVVAGSTRMAAGTAQKVALNVLSTTIMVRLHRVYDNLMVDLSSVNIKLEKRRVAILRRIVPSSRGRGARGARPRTGGRIKLAALLLRGARRADDAQALLDATGGDLRAAIQSRQHQRKGEETMRKLLITTTTLRSARSPARPSRRRR